MVIAIVLGTVGLIPSFANDYEGHLEEDAISYIVTNGYWTAGGDFGPDQPATRAQAASVIARYLSDMRPPYDGIFSDVSADSFYAGDIALAASLGVASGANGSFRPDDAITKQEFAIMLVRAYEIAGIDAEDSKYLTELILDYDDISDWAKSSVTKALGNNIMVGGMKKKFNPSAAVSRAELAAAVHKLYYAQEPFRTSYTVRDIAESDNIQADFNVLQDSSLYNSLGLSSFAMIARFDGAPGEIYVRRNKGTFNPSYGNMAAPATFAIVTDPNGFVVCRVDLDWKNSGTMEKIINIPEGPAGIYQVQIVNGIHMDSVSIGFKNPVSWGIRAEDSMVFSNTTPRTGYIYVPHKFDFLTLGIAGSQSTTLKLTTADGSVTIAETEKASNGMAGTYRKTTTVEKSALTPDTVYKYVLADNFRGRIAVTGITPVFCPTEEYARDLKGGYIMHTDAYATLQLTGPLQKRARERMVEIYEEMKARGNEKFEVDVTEHLPKFGSVPAELDNPIAEAQLFAAYSHSVYNLTGRIDTQCVDPTKSYFGASMSFKTTAENAGDSYPAKDWQVESYEPSSTAAAFSGAVAINSELNAYYNDPVIAKRAELAQLHLIVQSPASGLITYANTKGDACNDYYRTYENFMFGDHSYAEAYEFARKHFSPETRAITDEGFLKNADMVMNLRGQGPSNQLIMCMTGTVVTYCWTGEERYHKQAKQQILGFVAPNAKDNYHGQAKLGYFIESGGADDSSYGRMCEGLWSLLVMKYLTLPESMQDPQLKNAIIEAEEKYLEWDSYFYTPATANFSSSRPAQWTSRVNAPLGGGSAVTGNAYLVNLFPRAKKNWLVQNLGNEYKNYKDYNGKYNTGTTASTVVNETVARKHLANYLKSKANYDGYYSSSSPSSYRPSFSQMYYVWHQDQQFNDNEMPILPYETEGDGNIMLDEKGIVAIKHKGLYVLTYFNNSMSNGALSGISWLGGGPTSIWDDYFANTLLPRKPGMNRTSAGSYSGDDVYKAFNVGSGHSANYRSAGLTTDDILHSCIIGTDASGNLVTSGREATSFSWIEKDKSFKLTGKENISGKNIVWNYYLTDEGVSIDGGVDSVAANEDLYMQLPIYVQKGTTYTFDEVNKKLVIEHNGNKLTYRWYAPDAVIGETSTSTYKYLRIKLSATSPVATVKITRTMAS